jgi:Tol biopolymer transport system component
VLLLPSATAAPRPSEELAFVRGSGVASEIYVVRADADDWQPRFSPDGRRLAFTERSLPDDRRWVAVVNRDGSGSRHLVSGYEPDWRPLP